MKLEFPNTTMMFNRRQMESLKSTLLLISLLMPGLASAVDFTWNGFGTLALSGLDKYDVNERPTNVSFPYSTHTTRLDEKQDSRMAIQGTAYFNDQFSSTMQLLARGRNDFDVEVEWAYLSYQATEHLKFRLGRMRKPLFLYSDFYDVGYAYHWVRPPKTVYFDFGPFFNTIDSIDAYYQRTLNDWTYSVQAYSGRKSGSGSIGDLSYGYEELNTYGLVLNFEKETTNIRFGAHEAYFNMDIEQLHLIYEMLIGLGYPELGSNILIEKQKTPFLSASLTHRMGQWGLFAERISSEPENSVLPGINAWMLGISRVFGPVTLHFTHGRQSTINKHHLIAPIQNAADSAAAEGRVVTAGNLQAIVSGLTDLIDSTTMDRTSNGIGLRYELHDNAALKLEVERIKDNLLGGRSNLYSVSVDFLF